MNKYQHIHRVKEKSQINIRVSSDIYKLWCKIIQLEEDPKVTKGMLFGELISTYQDDPPTELFLSDSEKRKIELHQLIGAATQTLGSLKTELKTIEFELWKTTGALKLINIAVADDIYIEWINMNSAMKELLPFAQQSDVISQLIKNYLNIPSINDLIHADKLDSTPESGIRASKTEAKMQAALRTKLAKDAKVKKQI